MTSEECDYHFVTITEACVENSQTFVKLSIFQFMVALNFGI